MNIVLSYHIGFDQCWVYLCSKSNLLNSSHTADVIQLFAVHSDLLIDKGTF